MSGQIVRGELVFGLSVLLLIWLNLTWHAPGSVVFDILLLIPSKKVCIQAGARDYKLHAGFPHDIDRHIDRSDHTCPV